MNTPADAKPSEPKPSSSPKKKPWRVTVLYFLLLGAVAFTSQQVYVFWVNRSAEEEGAVFDDYNPDDLPRTPVPTIRGGKVPVSLPQMSPWTNMTLLKEEPKTLPRFPGTLWESGFLNGAGTKHGKQERRWLYGFRGSAEPIVKHYDDLLAQQGFRKVNDQRVSPTRRKISYLKEKTCVFVIITRTQKKSVKGEVAILVIAPAGRCEIP